MEKRYFEVHADTYVKDKDFIIYRPASLNNPGDNAVMFVTEGFMKYSKVLLNCRNCLVFWPRNIEVSNAICDRHAIFLCDNPHKEYCRFYRNNKITYFPEMDEIDTVNGAFIAKNAVIGRNCRILPGSYIGREVEIGDNCYIGSGVRLVGEVHIGNNVVIRENSVIGADGLSTDRDENEKALTMPQFGGIVIEDNVQIGALTVIARGAIDNTVIKSGAKIDNSVFISHNVQIGKDTFIVGETIMFGSSSTGNRVFISGNSTIRDGRHIGDGARIGMGSVVVKNVDNYTVVKGNPAR